ncbi:MAG: dihydrodipicolinate synthase family protein [Rhodospirillales bacterium]|nr:dihydrodipicolinate synthase family protein [Rhodospirillales bacterium]
MVERKRFQGVLVPALTPFKADLSPDTERFVKHCRWLFDQGVDGLAPFGTTSEANSMSAEERMELLEAMIEGGCPAEKLMPGTGTCNITESVKLTKHAVSLKCGGALMLPPFYYKGMSDQGLFDSFAHVIDKVGDASLQVYLYHIPPQTGVPISLKLIEMLVKAYPNTVVGLKDSGGDWNNTAAILSNFPGFTVFPGSEVFLLQGLRAGGAGCITATGNANPAGIREVFAKWKTDQADDLQNRITEVRKTIQAYPMIPAMKQMVAHFFKAPGWEQVRPPMVKLDDARTASLLADLKKVDFKMA